MAICISTGSLWRAAGSRLEAVDIVRKKFSGLIDGVELCFIDLKGLEGFELDEKNTRFLKGLKFNSMHAPMMEYAQNRETEKVFGKMRRISEDAKLNHITFHPDMIKDFSILGSLGVKACIENMACGERHSGWQKPGEIKNFLESEKDIGFCFDVNHAMANGIDPAEFLRALGNRISCVHLNATETAGRAEHGFVFSSSTEVRKKIDPVFSLAVPLIIEVDIGKEKVPLIGKEIAYTREKTMILSGH
jgi:hypothetical protein